MCKMYYEASAVPPRNWIRLPTTPMIAEICSEVVLATKEQTNLSVFVLAYLPKYRSKKTDATRSTQTPKPFVAAPKWLREGGYRTKQRRNG